MPASIAGVTYEGSFADFLILTGMNADRRDDQRIVELSQPVPRPRLSR
jgi:hypothetical protein